MNKIIKESSLILRVNEVENNAHSKLMNNHTALILGSNYFDKLGVIPGEIVIVKSVISGITHITPVEIDTEEPNKVKLQGSISNVFNNVNNIKIEVIKLSLININV
jgi:hypothetical protein